MTDRKGPFWNEPPADTINPFMESTALLKKGQIDKALSMIRQEIDSLASTCRALKLNIDDIERLIVHGERVAESYEKIMDHFTWINSLCDGEALIGQEM